MSDYGKAEGISDRLLDWVDRLGKDKNLPWVGLGLIADLQTAANLLEGKQPAPKKQELEFDL